MISLAFPDSPPNGVSTVDGIEFYYYEGDRTGSFCKAVTLLDLQLVLLGASRRELLHALDNT